MKNIIILALSLLVGLVSCNEKPKEKSLIEIIADNAHEQQKQDSLAKRKQDSINATYSKAYQLRGTDTVDFVLDRAGKVVDFEFKRSKIYLSTGTHNDYHFDNDAGSINNYDPRLIHFYDSTLERELRAKTKRQ